MWPWSYPVRVRGQPEQQPPPVQRRPWLIAGIVVALTACTSTTTPPAGGPAPAPSARTAPAQPTEPGGTINACPRVEPRRLTALTLNIHSGRTNDGALDLATVAAELRAWDADVVMLQEVDRGRARSDFEAQAGELGSLLGLEHAFGPTRQLRPGTTGNAVLTRFPVRDVRNVALPRLPGLGLFRRSLLAVTIDIGGQEVEVMSTHLDHLRPAARRVQAAAVADVVLRTDRPMLLGGDLNAEPGLPPLTVLDRAGLADPWPVIGTGNGLTVPAGDPQRRIDYVLADDSFVPLRSEVLISFVSDHRAVRTSFELLPPDACS